MNTLYNHLKEMGYPVYIHTPLVLMIDYHKREKDKIKEMYFKILTHSTSSISIEDIEEELKLHTSSKITPELQNILEQKPKYILEKGYYFQANYTLYSYIEKEEKYSIIVVWEDTFQIKENNLSSTELKLISDIQFTLKPNSIQFIMKN